MSRFVRAYPMKSTPRKPKRRAAPQRAREHGRGRQAAPEFEAEEPDEEEVDDEYEEDIDGDLGLWVDEIFGAHVPRGRPNIDEPTWSRPIMLGRNVKLHARSGSRAAYIDLGKGLYLVGEVPEAFFREEVGGVFKAAASMLTQGINAIDRKVREAKNRKRARMASGAPARAGRPTPRGRRHDVPAIGCDGRRCNCGSN